MKQSRFPIDERRVHNFSEADLRNVGIGREGEMICTNCCNGHGGHSERHCEIQYPNLPFVESVHSHDKNDY